MHICMYFDLFELPFFRAGSVELDLTNVVDSIVLGTLGFL
jgi:hypothetical protein